MFLWVPSIAVVLPHILFSTFFIKKTQKVPGEQYEFELIYLTFSVLSSRKLPWDLIKKL